MSTTVRKPALPTVMDASLTTTVSGQSVAVAKPTVQTPSYVPRLSGAATTDTPELARVVDRIATELRDTTAAARANPMQSHITIKNVTVGTGGATTQLPRHGFGVLAHWMVVGWRGVAGGAAGAGPSLEEDPALTTTSTLALKSYVAGVADVMVWGKP